jgi:hypothetical protein
MGKRSHNHISEATLRQVERRLACWPDVSYARIAGEFGISLATVQRIAGKKGRSRFRPRRLAKDVVRCSGCGGLKRKNRDCLVCRDRAEVQARRQRRAAASAGGLPPAPRTGSTPAAVT